MSRPASHTPPPELLAALPEPLRAFLARGGERIETEEDDWEVAVKGPPKHLAKYLPPGAVLIGANGVGDHLFLVPDKANPALLARKVQVYWHEGPEIAVIAEDIAALVEPPPATATARSSVFYHDGQTAVRLGDEVTARSFFVRRPGRVVYVPGLSKRNRDMEHHGLCWVGITLSNGALVATVVDPDTSRLKKSVRFVKHSTEPFKEMGPRERLE